MSIGSGSRGTVCTLVLFHVVFPRKCFVARGTDDVFLARVFFAMAGGVAAGGEGVGAGVAGSVGTRIFFLGACTVSAIGVVGVGGGFATVFINGTFFGTAATRRDCGIGVIGGGGGYRGGL